MRNTDEILNLHDHWRVQTTKLTRVLFECGVKVQCPVVPVSHGCSAGSAGHIAFACPCVRLHGPFLIKSSHVHRGQTATLTIAVCVCILKVLPTLQRNEYICTVARRDNLTQLSHAIQDISPYYKGTAFPASAAWKQCSARLQIRTVSAF